MVIAAFAPKGPLRGEVRVPGDKSISHRALILSALARGTSRITGLATGDDVASTAGCLRALGVEVAPDLAVAGKGSAPAVAMVTPARGGLRPPPEPLDAGNSGTTMRLLSGVLAGQPFWSRLDGDASLRRRPMSRVAEPLRRMGAEVRCAGGGRSAPLDIRGPRPAGPLAAGDHVLAVASAQVKSCLLLAGLHASGRTTVIEPLPSRDHTERMLGAFGVKVLTGPGGPVSRGSRTSRAGFAATVESEGVPGLMPADLAIPGDFSTAAFWIVAALLVPGSEVRLGGVGTNPTRTGLMTVLARMGAGDRIALENRLGPGEGGGGGRGIGTEPVGDIVISGLEPASNPGRPGAAAGALRATRVGADEVPGLIDEVPILAVAATQAAGTTIIEGAGELRVKESDRLSALASELGRMGAQVEARGDNLIITGPTPLRPARVFSLGDHRIAMALAVAALVAGRGDTGRASGCTEVEGFEAAGISYPEFGRDLEVLTA